MMGGGERIEANENADPGRDMLTKKTLPELIQLAEFPAHVFLLQGLKVLECLHSSYTRLVNL